MSFRLISVPLNKRTEQIARNNELITDTVHGNVGINIIDENNKSVYNSGTEKIKTDIDSLKLRNDMMIKNLSKINYGSENNVEDKDFNITKALEDKDILGSLQYIINQYSPYVKGFNSKNNVVLNERAFSYKNDLKKIINKLYEPNPTSYEHQFKDIIKNYTNDIDDSTNSNNFGDNLKLQKIINEDIPLLYDLESKIVNMEKTIYSINRDLNDNIPNILKDLDSDLKLLKYRTKSKKFKSFKFMDENTNPIKYYQTENTTVGYEMPEELKNFENLSNTFEDNFITSILDDNYDGDINLHKIDSKYNNPTLYNRTDMTRSYNLDKQKYFYIPDVNTRYSLVYDPILKRPIYRTKTIDDIYTTPQSNQNYNSDTAMNISFYNNENNYILQNIMTNDTDLVTFECKNMKDLTKIFRFQPDISHTIGVNKFDIAGYYFPTVYHYSGFNNLDVSTAFNFDFNSYNFDYFIAPSIMTNNILSDTTKINILIRDTLIVYNDSSSDDDFEINQVFYTNKNNNRLSLNNRRILAHNYYSGVNVTSTECTGLSIDDVKNDFNTYISSLSNTLDTLIDDIDNDEYCYPKISDTDILIDDTSNYTIMGTIDYLSNNLSLLGISYNFDDNIDYERFNTSRISQNKIELTYDDVTTNPSTTHTLIYTFTDGFDASTNFTIKDAFVDIINAYNVTSIPIDKSTLILNINHNLSTITF